ncbi:MAG: hypothetical protein UU24_C0005G0031 [Candidatus Nomurabacteria bacterium GW2011_GWA2_40_9]|uniref:AAA+ ATPase domain-containing protein n=1 Tax=Candidatus Nomurabacteria bacterium GW2011_GWA2_40_9 TaxID=1618734 RepID=A0A0G0TRM5_9BACT|nr:MAG: hypothetical protein UU24_C0005G0031 [Candidatus Nomurabacteria bacterium GW2011_GWA2_40_9]
MKEINRIIELKIKEKLFDGRVVILYGPRRVGKTTLVKKLIREYGGKYFSCEEPDVARALTNKTSTEMKKFLGDAKLVILDEAQKIHNIGTSLKLLIDNFPDMQIIATGSSSFDLANKINEPLTGRNWEFHLYPFSMAELTDSFGTLETNRLLDFFLTYGTYPEVVFENNNREDLLEKITNDYLYKDILSYEGVRKPEILKKILRLLALQVGQLVSYSEIAEKAETSRDTVRSYIEILEKAFIIFKLPPLTKRKRDEIKLMNKIYFFDTGILNTLLQNYNMPEFRKDKGHVFENFFIAEKMKQRSYQSIKNTVYYWRNKSGNEIDFIEEYRTGEEYRLFECKYTDNKKIVIPSQFIETYGTNKIQIISKENILENLS